MLKLLLALLKRLGHYIITFEENDLDIVVVVHNIKQSATLVAEYLFNFEDMMKQTEELFSHIAPLLSANLSRSRCKKLFRTEEQFRQYFLSQQSRFAKDLQTIDPDSSLAN